MTEWEKINICTSGLSLSFWKKCYLKAYVLPCINYNCLMKEKQNKWSVFLDEAPASQRIHRTKCHMLSKQISTPVYMFELWNTSQKLLEPGFIHQVAWVIKHLTIYRTILLKKDIWIIDFSDRKNQICEAIFKNCWWIPGKQIMFFPAYYTFSPMKAQSRNLYSRKPGWNGRWGKHFDTLATL